ncbi:DUF4041 domain-containing protein [Promicromonospora kroppenstedtii]|uniref:DUF4041 domain-containing protein n=1 Tax=Promicromonospora kroppenstedtii TaxID=440482 RepID=A0ABW7XPV7_9MICO
MIADRTSLPSSSAVPSSGSLPPDVARESAKVPLFGARRVARELGAEAEALRAELARVGALDAIQIEEERRSARQRFEDQERELEQGRAASLAKFSAEADALTKRRDALAAEVAGLTSQVANLEETLLLQEVGIYEYQHPLENADAYRARLDVLRVRIKEMAKKDGGAVTGAQGWTVNGSKAEGKRMVSQTSKLMLRAYNGEADALLRGMRPYRLDASLDRLNKSFSMIAKLGASMQISIDSEYHRLRVEELRLTADFLAKNADEKEREKEERARLREERKVEQQLQREKEKLEKERQHYENARAALLSKGDVEGAARLAEQIEDVARKIEDVDYRAANHRAGYVYVISNLGAFGEHMIKIGMTRRLDPMDRVRELGDASVPFNFDVHSLFFANDAVGIEAEMHRRLGDRRVNRVNMRREFFYATPQEALEQLRDLAGDVLQFEEIPEAIEFRQSQTLSQTLS